jgi:hypothetical protein
VRNELQWRWIWGSIDDGSCCAENIPDDANTPHASSCVEIKRVSRGCQFQTKMLFPMAGSAAET